MTERKYGYGIVDRHGAPWWDESCVCQDIEPMREVCANLNDDYTLDLRQPYRVVKLVWLSKRKPAKARK